LAQNPFGYDGKDEILAHTPYITCRLSCRDSPHLGAKIV